MQFCPLDGTLLQMNVLHHGPLQELRFICPVCPYVHTPSRVTSEVHTQKKRIEAVEDENWDSVDKTEALCPNGHREAYFMQIQIRSADEPMTTFFKCVSCGVRWNQ